MTEPDQPTPRVPADELCDFVTRALRAAGLPETDAAHAAELMTEADLRGTDTHGVFRLPTYARRITAGTIKARPHIRIVEERAATALVDGDNGMGHLVMRFAAQTAIAKARRGGMGWVGVRGSNHSGSAALYAMMPLAHDMVGLCLSVSGINHLPPTGGAEALLGTNPIAIAVPALDEPPVVMDMSPTVASYGKVRLAAARGEPMPVGWMVERDGTPLTDASRAADGVMLPIGGYKGYGLALMIGLVAGQLNGAAFGRGVSDPGKVASNTGQAVAAIAIDAFAPVEEFRRSIDESVRTIRGSARLPGVERIWLPGEQSHLTRLERSARGIPMPETLRRSLDALARELGIDPVL